MILTSDNDGFNKFMKHLEKELKKTKTSLILSVSDVFIDTARVGGYFDEANNKIVVKLDEYFLEILVHEYCHYIQWKKNSKVWLEQGDSIDLMWKWINKEIELDKKHLNIIFDKIVKLESDCEKRAIKMIKKYNLDINLEQYIKCANAYVLFYDYVKEKRVWLKDDQGMYSFKKVLDKVSGKEIEKPNPNTYKLFDYYF